MSDSHIPFSALACDRQRFWKRFTMSEAIAFTWGAHRARLQNCSAHSKGSANDGPMAWSQGRAHIPKAQPMTGQWRAGVGRAAHHSAARPEGPPHHPGPPTTLRLAPPPPTALQPMGKQLLSHWPSAGTVLQARPVRAPRKSNGKALGKALPKTAREVKGK